MTETPKPGTVFSSCEFGPGPGMAYKLAKARFANRTRKDGIQFRRITRDHDEEARIFADPPKHCPDIRANQIHVYQATVL